MEEVFITSVMTVCIIRVAVSNLMVLIMVLIMVIKDIKVVRSGVSALEVLYPCAPVLHPGASGVLLFLHWLLLCRHGQRYVPLVYKWSSRRWSFVDQILRLV